MAEKQGSLRDLFPGYHRPLDSEIDQVWAGGIVSVDTNILLNLYRYSEPTRTALLDALSLFESRLWIPHHVASEFHQRRLELVHNQHKHCGDWIKALGEILARLDDRRQHPFLSSGLRQKFEDLKADVEREVNTLAKQLESYWFTDPIMEKIQALFDGKVGPQIQDLQQARKEGTERMNAEIPPGYKDKGKPGDKALGDYFLWRQLLAYAKEQQSSVMFITDDEKEDWWYKVGGRTFGPQPALVDEMRRQSGGHPFLMYTAERFLEFARIRLKVGSDLAVREARETREAKDSPVPAEQTLPSSAPTVYNVESQGTFALLGQMIAALLQPNGIELPSISSSRELIASEDQNAREKRLLEQREAMKRRLAAVDREIWRLKRVPKSSK